jgi:hypothetical protein
MRTREIACLVKAAVIAFTPYVAFTMIAHDAKARAARLEEDMWAREERCHSKAAALRAAAEAVTGPLNGPDASR